VPSSLPEDSPHQSRAAGGEPVEPTDLSSLAELRSVQLSADGRLLAAVVVRLPQETNRAEGTLVTGLVEGGVVGEAAPPAAGVSEDMPRWEPVSSETGSPRLATVRSDGTTWRVVLREVDGEGAAGEIEVELARWDDPVTELSWSPDGHWLLAVIREQQDRARLELPEDRRPPLHLTRLRYRYDGLGYTFNRPQQAFLIPAAGGPPRRLSRGGYDDSDFSWHPDARAVVFVSQRHDKSDRTLLNDIYVQSLDEFEPRQVTRTQFHYGQPAFSPNGTKLAATAVDVSHFPSTSDLVVLDPDSGETLAHFDDLDRDCSGPTTHSEGLIWADDDTILALAEDEGRICALSAHVNDASAERTVDGDRWVTSLAASSDGTLAYVTSSVTEPDALVVRRGSAEEEVVFAPNDSYRVSHDLRTAVHEIIETAPGVHVDSWLMLPDAGRWRAPFPLLVSMQGGGSQYGYHWSHESQTLCGAGFAVLYMNARGSGGYGKAWYRAVCGPNAASPAAGWGEDDISDMLAVVDATLERNKELDAERVGVLGGSYGALCVTWMLERSDLFCAGWAERGPYNLYSLAGTNDESPWFFTQYLGRNQVEDPAAYWTSSPLRRVAEITAPLMIVHSENDLRCPIQQAEELFMALKVLDRPVEFIRFPGEGHYLTRNGSPVHRLQRLELLLGWFTRWLKPQDGDGTGAEALEGTASEVDAARVTG
jgi:dipeptidyl aminopeptidase/acylaminoacyl peptidase